MSGLAVTDATLPVEFSVTLEAAVTVGGCGSATTVTCAVADALWVPAASTSSHERRMTPGDADAV